MTRRWTTWPDTCAARPKPPGSMAVGRAYGQTDLTWLSASASVSEPFRRNRLFRGDVRLDERIYTQNLFVSPCVERSIVDKVFDRGADFYYFNLHGSEAPTACASMLPTSSNVTRQSRPPAAGRPGRETERGVAEAVLWRKFQDYGRGETMLLAAMGGHDAALPGVDRASRGVASKSSSAADLEQPTA